MSQRNWFSAFTSGEENKTWVRYLVYVKMLSPTFGTDSL